MTKTKKNIIISVVVLIVLIAAAILGVYAAALLKYGGNDMRMGRYKSFNSLEALQKDYDKAYGIKLPYYKPEGELDEDEGGSFMYTVPGGFSAEDVVFCGKKLKRVATVSYKFRRRDILYIFSTDVSKINNYYETLSLLSDKIIEDENAEASEGQTARFYTLEKIYGLKNAEYKITVTANSSSGVHDKDFIDDEINKIINSI